MNEAIELKNVADDDLVSPRPLTLIPRRARLKSPVKDKTCNPLIRLLVQRLNELKPLDYRIKKRTYRLMVEG